MMKIKIIFTILFVACCLLLGCAPNGLVLRPTGRDVHVGSRDYHFANEIVGFDFYFIKTDEELMMPDQTTIFIENRTKFPMLFALSRENKKMVVAERVLPFGQGVVSLVLPYGEWLYLTISANKIYFMQIK